MVTPKLIMGAVGIFAAALLSLGSCTTIDTGNVGVKSSFGQVDLQEVPAGFTMKMPMVTSIDHYNVRETALDLNDLTPKAKDNLSLKDMDVTIFYEVEASRVAEVLTEFQGQTTYDDEAGLWLPGAGLVERLAREAIYDNVSKMESLTIHQRRDVLVATVKQSLQGKLNAVSPNTFRITNIAVRAITTDPSIEASIQRAVQAQKQLEQMSVQTEIAKKQAEVKITEAKGIAEANHIINNSLTREYLQHEANLTLQEFAKNGRSSTVVLPAGQGITPLINTGK